MKHLIIFLAFIALGITATAQVRGTYGTIQQYTPMVGVLYNQALTQKTADTLKGVDTIYAYFNFATPEYLQFRLQAVQKADSFSGTAILQAWAGDNTGWVTRTGYWESITGITALCTTCVGASKTFTIATGTNRATWDVGKTTISNWRIRVVGSRSTDTTAITALAWYSY